MNGEFTDFLVSRKLLLFLQQRGLAALINAWRLSETKDFPLRRDRPRYHVIAESPSESAFSNLDYLSFQTYVGAPVIALPQGRMVANKISGSRQAIGNGGTETEPHANSHPPAVRGSFLSMASNMERKPFDTTSNRTSRSSISRVKYAMGLCADDPRTPKGRRNQMAKILFMAGLPIVILLAQTITSTVQALREQGHANAFIVEVDFAIQAGAVVHALGLERGTSTFFVGHPDGAQGEMLFKPVVVR